MENCGRYLQFPTQYLVVSTQLVRVGMSALRNLCHHLIRFTIFACNLNIPPPLKHLDQALGLPGVSVDDLAAMVSPLEHVHNLTPVTIATPPLGPQSDSRQASCSDACKSFCPYTQQLRPQPLHAACQSEPRCHTRSGPLPVAAPGLISPCGPPRLENIFVLVVESLDSAIRRCCIGWTP